jgi:outer membrane protein TolC
MKTTFLFGSSVAIVAAAVLGFGAAESIRADAPTDGMTNAPARRMTNDVANSMTNALAPLGTEMAHELVTSGVTNGLTPLGAGLKAVTTRECIERALAQNLDIKLEKINPTIQQWGVVNAQGVYDPVLSSQFQYNDNHQPLDPSTATSLGMNSLETKQLQAQLGLNGKLPTGATYNFTYNDTRALGTQNPNGSLVTNFVYTGGAVAQLTQPLLKNSGFGVNSAAIRVARKNKQIEQETFVLKVMTIVTSVENAYYELVYAIENHKAVIEDFNRAKQLLTENRRRVDVGMMSPLDVVQAEAGVAEREEAVITAAQTIKNNENALKRLISQDVMEFRGMGLLPVDYPGVQAVELDVSRSIRTALEKRPEYIQAKQQCDLRDIVVKYNRNQLWPQVDLVGSYGFNARSPYGIPTPTGGPFPFPPSTGGTFSDFLGSLRERDNPTWGVGVVLSFPLGNRQARATYHISRLQSMQAVINLKATEQNIIVAVDNAVAQVQTNLKRVDATRAASRLGLESLNAEEKKLRAGTSTSFLVLQAQSQLAAAKSSEIRARADYDESLANLALAEGTTLEKNQIVLKEDD